MKRIGFIGLGIMGESMSENILKKAEVPVMVFNRTPEKANKLVEMGAERAASIQEIGEKCDRIFMIVTNKDSVTAVIEQLLPVLRKGQIVIDMSTIEPSVSAALAKRVKQAGADMIDAPVVRSKAAAIAGELGIYVGGEKETFEEVKTLLSYMGKDIIYMGKNGKGLMMKICHNMMLAQIQNSVNEMLIMIKAAEMDMEDVCEAISYGSGQNMYLDSKKEAIKGQDFEARFSVENMNKDVNIAKAFADELDLNLPGLNHVTHVYKGAMEKNMNDKDYSITLKVVEEMSEKSLLS
jgi:3-hydroxyisobutyrate dehydrogenase